MPTYYWVSEEYKAEMREKVSALSDVELARELYFAEGFYPDPTQGADEWLKALRAENEKRQP